MIVDEDGRTGGDHGVVAVRLAVFESEHLHVQVLQREDRCEAAEVRLEILELDALDVGPGATAILVVREELDHRFDVADVLSATAVGTTGVQAGG